MKRRCALVGSGVKPGPYQRTTGSPATVIRCRPGLCSCSSPKAGWHASAPRLDRGFPRSISSAVRWRAIGTLTLATSAEGVNRNFEVRVLPRCTTA